MSGPGQAFDTERANAPWRPSLPPHAHPLYLAIADALAGDLHHGRLSPGERLPPQRELAQALGVDLTTVTRAYAEARGRGLIEARVGQGTFVRGRSELPGRAPDVSMNLPPVFDDLALVRRMWEG
ncbi:MAG: winged helix-turn-helix domain-containing protein, partial [Caulobacteraceae bacterium]